MFGRKKPQTCADVEKKCSRESDGIGKMLHKMVSILGVVEF